MTYSPITRSLRSTTFTLSTALVLLLACDGDLGNGGTSTAPGTSTLPGLGGASGSLPPVSGTVIPGNGGASSVQPSNGGATVVQQTGTGVSSTGGVTGSGGSKSTASGGSKATTQNTSATTGGTNSTGSCTDTPRPDETCAQAKEWGFCDDQWFIDGGYCKKTCNLCSSTSSGTGGVTGSGGSKSTATGGTKATATGGTKATGSTTTVTATGGGGGGGETVKRLTNGKDGKTTRYWDCCKPSCGWAENAQKGGKQATKTCGSDGVSSVGAATQSACSGGSATQCYSFAPWSVSDTLAYGFAATSASANSVCGKCFQLDFTGSGDNANASALSNKTMIVQAINIGGDVGGDQFDLLIPGGGVGAFNACSNQWGASDLGAQYGGFLTKCGTSMSCVTDMCKAAFGSKPDLMAGCNWFTTWFNGANNPKIKYAEVACPSAIASKSGM